MYLTRSAAVFMLRLGVGGGATAQSTGRQRLSMDPEWLQLSLRREEGVTVSPGSYGVDVESIVLR
jgi:hypothetical protein